MGGNPSRSSGSRDIHDLIDKVKALPGWRVTLTAKNGWKCWPPDPNIPPCTINHGPRQPQRAVLNARAKLRRMGADL